MSVINISAWDVGDDNCYDGQNSCVTVEGFLTLSAPHFSSYSCIKGEML